MRLKVGLLGIGKIARDQHIPALNANPRFELAACASRNATVDGVPSFPDLETMLAAVPDLHCISICTPPQAHFDAALIALRAGKHVMLEKPPAATTRQIALLADEAARRGRTLFQTWHSRFAAGVDAAREFLRTRKLVSGKIIWKEDVHHWHPGPALDLGAGWLRRVRPGHQRVVGAHRDPAEGCLRRRRAARVPGEPAVTHRRRSSHAYRRRRRDRRRVRFPPERRAELGHRARDHHAACSSWRAAAPSSPSTASP